MSIVPLRFTQYSARHCRWSAVGPVPNPAGRLGRNIAPTRSRRCPVPNRLANEVSPYLQQHKDNPVDWYPWGAEALAKAKAEDKPTAGQHRLLRLPLVPRHGARVVRGPDDRRADERALRQHQGRPRRAAGHRFALHDRGPGHERPGRLAVERLPDAGWHPVLRRHLLAAGGPDGHAVVPAGARCGRRDVGHEARTRSLQQGEQIREMLAQRPSGYASMAAMSSSTSIERAVEHLGGHSIR